MPELVMPTKFALAVKQGFERGRKYRRARAMYIREYVGKYYTNQYGLTGEEPINLIFSTIRAMVPNIVMRSGVNEVGTEIVPYRDYAYLLGLALDFIDRKTKFKDVLRAAITDAFFLMGILKTGLATGGKMINFGDVLIDDGQIYTDHVDFDDFVVDPSCKDFRKAAFIGDSNRVPRQILLDDNEFNHDLVMQIPKSYHPDTRKKVEALSKKNFSDSEIYELQDFVDVVEVFVPKAGALVTIPDPRQKIFNDYLAIREFYGPEDGPYTIFSLTQPVPGNPFPVAPVSIHYDLHKMANRMMTKTMNQADRQKDIGVYDPAGADEAEDIRTSEDGDMIAGNPDTVKVISLGGQNSKSESFLRQLQIWHNYMSGNPDQIAGLASEAETATQASILQANSVVTIEDARSMAYDAAAEANSKMAWYLHTDPFVNMLLAKREPGGKYIQLTLSDEQKRGDFLEYTFKMKARSMSQLDPAVRTKRIIEFATNLIPSLVTSATMAMQIGIPFNLQEAITDLADEMGILEDVQDWFVDPTFLQRIQLQMAMGPQPAGKAQAMPVSGPKGIPQQTKIQTPFQERKQTEQLGAVETQSARTSEPGV